MKGSKKKKAKVKSDDDFSLSSDEECEKLTLEAQTEESEVESDPEYIQFKGKRKESLEVEQDEMMSKYFPSFSQLPPKTRSKLLEDIFEGKNESILRRKKISDQNERLVTQLKK